MKKIIEFLESNGIEYRRETYGNPYYYDDGFRVPALVVTFDYELTADKKEMEQKESLFKQYIKRRKGFCIPYSGVCGIYIPHYTVMSVFDYHRHAEHEAQIKEDVEKFWKVEHARREAEKLAAVM